MFRNERKKKFAALLLAFILMLTNNGVFSYALEVKDGDTTIEVPDGTRWQYFEDTDPDTGMEIKTHLFDENYAENELTVALDEADLHNTAHEEGEGNWVQDEDKTFIFINGATGIGDLSENDNVRILKDTSSNFEDANGELEPWGGEFDPIELPGGGYPENPNDPDSSNYNGTGDVSSGIINSLELDFEGPMAVYYTGDRPGTFRVFYDCCWNPEANEGAGGAEAGVEYSFDGTNYTFVWPGDEVNFLKEDGTPYDNVTLKLYVPIFYADYNIEPMVEIPVDEDPDHNLKSYDGGSLSVTKPGDDYIMTYAINGSYDPFNFEVYWSEFFMARTGPGEYQVRSFIRDGSGSVTYSEDVPVFSHPAEVHDMPNEQIAVCSGTVNAILNPGEGCEVWEVNLGDYCYTFSDSHETGPDFTRWTSDGNTGITFENGKYQIAISGETYFEVAFTGGHPGPGGPSTLRVNYDPGENASVTYSYGSSTVFSALDNGNLDLLEENGDSKGTVNFLLTPPDSYRGKNVVPMVEIRFDEDPSNNIGNFGSLSGINLTSEGTNYKFSYDFGTDLTHQEEMLVYWSDFYRAVPSDTEFVLTSQNNNGHGTFHYSPGPKNNEVYNHPDFENAPNQENRIFDKPTSGSGNVEIYLEPENNRYWVEILTLNDTEYIFNEASRHGADDLLFNDVSDNCPLSVSGNGIVVTIDSSMMSDEGTSRVNLMVRFDLKSRTGSILDESGLGPLHDDFSNAKSTIENILVGYATMGTTEAEKKEELKADLAWELWYDNFGYLKKKRNDTEWDDHCGDYYGMLGTVSHNDTSKKSGSGFDYREDRRPYTINYDGPAQEFIDAITIESGPTTAGSLIEGVPYYTFKVDFTQSDFWESGQPEYAMGKVYLLENYTDIVLKYNDLSNVTRYKVVDASMSTFEGRTVVSIPYRADTVSLFGNGAAMVGSSSREGEKDYRFSGHVTQEYSNLQWRREYTYEPNSSSSSTANSGKPGISCNLGIVNSTIEGFDVSGNFEKGTAAAWGWTDWPLYWTNNTSPSSPTEFELYKGSTSFYISSMVSEPVRPAVTNVECTLPYASKAVSIETVGDKFLVTLLSDFYDEVPLKITYDNGHVGYAKLKFVAIDIQIAGGNGSTSNIWHGSDNSREVEGTNVVSASYYYLNDQNTRVNIFATLNFHGGKKVTKLLSPVGSIITNANQGTNKVDDFIIWKRGDDGEFSFPDSVEVIAVIPDSGDTFGGALIGSGSGVRKSIQ